MQVTRHMVLLACLLTVSISFCKQENVEEYTEEGVDEEIVGDEKPPTAAEQYLDFISGGGNLEEDVGEGNSGFEGPPPPEGYEEVVGNDGEDDYGVESLNLLLSMQSLFDLRNINFQKADNDMQAYMAIQLLHGQQHARMACRSMFYKDTRKWLRGATVNLIS